MLQLSVPIQPDPDGYTGRECPSCKRYFKVKAGGGLPGGPPCHCPYCNHVGPPDEFVTEDQIGYAKSVALNKFTRAFLADLKQLERRPDPHAFISIGITVRGSPEPIIHYSEKDLEEHVTCSACTLQYAIYGAFGYCPGCGVHNSLQIVSANLDLAAKMLDLAKSATPDVAAKLIENALEDAVSSFDGFGREHCAELPYKISFQNIEGAREKLLMETGVDLAAGLDGTRWAFVCTQFQKRHLLAHKMGVVDQEFIARTGASPSLLGRKVVISAEDVRALVGELRHMAATLFEGVART